MADVSANTKTTARLDLSQFGSFGTYSGSLEQIGDHDWVKVTLQAGTSYKFYLSQQSTGLASGDAELTLLDDTGKVITMDDDSGAGSNAYIIYTPSATGTFYLDVHEHNDDSHGSYTLVMDRGPGTDHFLDAGAESYTASSQERVDGGAGNDNINLGVSGYDAIGGQGDDSITGNGQSNYISGGSGNDNINADAGGDIAYGDTGDDYIYGGSGADELHGGAGDDDLDGGADNDIVIGGAGTDQMYGGTGADKFVFKSTGDSVKGVNRDWIYDFSHAEGDKIDLHSIDANTKHSGNDAFKYIGTAGFHHKAGELHYHNHILAGDVNGDGKADFEMHINTSSLQASDFIL